MEHHEKDGGDAVVSQRVADIVVAVGMFAIGVVMMVDNYHLGAGWAPDGPQSGYFPFRIGAIICIASVAVLAQTFFYTKGGNQAFVTRERVRHVLLVFVPTVVYVFAIQWLGIYVASALLVAGFMRLMDKYSWLKTLVISVGVNAVLFWLFEIQFLVPLPKGPLEAFFGY
ncbi:MAG: tripartite tricarboxylate transporter TctB family protein [Burkholderiales bacterium]